jgi:HEAT repeat protein
VRIPHLSRCGAVGFCAVLAFALSTSAKDEPNSELVQMVVNLLSEKDKDLRAVGLDQVRNEAKGTAATKQFAAQLPKLNAAEQAGLLSALADRGDTAALPAVIELLPTSRDETVRAAAVGAVGSLGTAADLPLLLKSLADGSAAEKAAARAAIGRLRGDAVPGEIAAAIKTSSPPVRSTLIEILADRRALATVNEILAAATGNDAKVRAAAVAALAQLASAEHTPRLFEAVLKAEKGPERDTTEKAFALVVGRIDDAGQRANTVLSAWSKCSAADQIALLPTLGRVGGEKIYAVVKAAMASDDSQRREAGLRALCNWPDTTVSDELLGLAEQADTAAHRAMTFQAFVRIGSTRDNRTDLERLDRMKQAMSAAKTDEERALVVNRCRTAYSIESLRYVLPYLEQPTFVQLACETIVELAHHRELREPNKTEFDPALDKVIKLSHDAVVVDRANRYKRGETWARPKPADATNSQ